MERIEQLAALGLFDASVPRYTSYPTATEFGPGIEAQAQARWLEALEPGTRASVYVHIPFCERLCWFCACRTQGVTRAEPVARYLEVLEREIDLVAARLPAGVEVTRLHWGGGTPTILDAAQIGALARRLRARFDVAEDAEFAVEIDPTVLDAERVAALAAGGMTRASIGVQDIDPAIQAAIGRRQSLEVTLAAVEALRAAGVGSLNVDMVYGLPHQDVAGLEASTRAVLGMAPDRVALFGYAHVPWAARRQRMIDAEALPGPRARLALAEAAEAVLVAGGYQALGIDHFARPGDGLAVAAREGRMRRNFQGYVDDGADVLIGLGASSISRFPGGYVQNAPATAAYAGRIGAGALAGARGVALGLEDRVRARFIERLLCDLEVSWPEIEREFGSFAALLRPDIDAALARFSPWLAWSQGRLVLRPGAKPLARLVASAFDAHPRAGAGRHSRAI